MKTVNNALVTTKTVKKTSVKKMWDNFMNFMNTPVDYVGLTKKVETLNKDIDTSIDNFFKKLLKSSPKLAEASATVTKTVWDLLVYIVGGLVSPILVLFGLQLGLAYSLDNLKIANNKWLLGGVALVGSVATIASYAYMGLTSVVVMAGLGLATYAFNKVSSFMFKKD